MTPGQKTVVFGAQVNTAWKPVLLFGAKDAMLPTDVVVSDMPDKEHHTWGQSESGMAGLISLLSRPGDLVCDPFVGAGTTAVEALRAGRRFVGCDIDEECVKRSIQRCAEVLDGVQAGRDLEEGYVDIGQTP
jgi:DNA modification methylase